MLKQIPNTVAADVEPLLLSQNEAARLLRVSLGTVHNLRRRGALRTIKIGARRLVPIDELKRLIARELQGTEAAKETWRCKDAR